MLDKIPSQGSKRQYMIQLDALRALAVFGVLIHHYLPQDFILNSRFHVGRLGVQLFFVLSGFLITGILLRCKETIDLRKQDRNLTIKRFYIRRFLRLLPAYYLAIILSIIIAFQDIKPSLTWHLSYTSNIYFSNHSWDAISSHFWSLSVEEQFYLVWPWVIFLTPKYHLLKVMLVVIATAPIFRLTCLVMGWTNGSLEYIFTFACLDSLAAGAILAFYTYYNHQYHKKLLCNFACWIGTPAFILLNFAHIPFIHSSVLLVITSTVDSIFFIWLVDRAARGFSGSLGNFLELKLITDIGKISYGIYIFHLLAQVIVQKTLFHFAPAYFGSIGVKFTLSTAITLMIAVLSWNFIEKPINHLKYRFEYIRS
jgi:peptidoglycan/LPS O-acetylase OafA/YrhL